MSAVNLGKNITVFPQTSPQVLQHIARMDASYSATFSQEEIQQHALLASKIDNETVAIVDAIAFGRCALACDSGWI